MIADEANLLAELDSRARASAGFDQRSHERQRFIYLVGIVAVALTDAVRTDKRFVAVVSHLRRMVRVEMQNRWGDTDETADSAIAEAGQDCARLIFTFPQEDPALSLTWPQEWLKRGGVDEVNPAVLFQISHAWKEQYLKVSKVTSQAEFLRDSQRNGK